MSLRGIYLISESWRNCTALPKNCKAPSSLMPVFSTPSRSFSAFAIVKSRSFFSYRWMRLRVSDLKKALKQQIAANGDDTFGSGGTNCKQR